jgi:hypothetical protein
MGMTFNTLVIQDFYFDVSDSFYGNFAPKSLLRPVVLQRWAIKTWHLEELNHLSYFYHSFKDVKLSTRYLMSDHDQSGSTDLK